MAEAVHGLPLPDQLLLLEPLVEGRQDRGRIVWRVEARLTHEFCNNTPQSRSEFFIPEK